MQTRLLVDELRDRGYVCQVLKINEGRQQKSPEYTDVQNAIDYLKKVVEFAWEDFSFHIHVNAESPKGYILALVALLVARVFRHPAALTFHGGFPQKYLAYPETRWLNRSVFRVLFRMPNRILCNSSAIRGAICAVGAPPDRVDCIPAFSLEYTHFEKVPLPEPVDAFFASHQPLFFSYVSFRPEYRLEVLRESMSRLRESKPKAGFIWLGFPAKEKPVVDQFVSQWPPDEQSSLLLLGNVDHDMFLTLLSRCDAFVRTPACDGVSASILEALAIGVPVVASENGRRPRSVLTYAECDAIDLCDKLRLVIERHDEIKAGCKLDAMPNNIARIADWLLGDLPSSLPEEPAYVA
jgi:glycosyltransferase involved in cell wall biosynthesis